MSKKSDTTATTGRSTPSRLVIGKMYRVPAVEKCFEILDCFQNGVAELSLADIIHMTKIQKTTVYRILFTLETIQYVRKGKENGRYRLGTRCMDLAVRFLSSGGITDICQPLLMELVDTFGETACLALRRGGKVVYANIVESPHSVRMVASVGEQVQYHSTALGKAVAAHLSSAELEAVLQKGLPVYTPNTITDIEQLMQELELVKVQGYSLDNEENEAGASCIGAPILGYESEPLGAISISGPTGRVITRRAEIETAIRKTATSLTLKLHFFRSS